MTHYHHPHAFPADLRRARCWRCCWRRSTRRSSPRRCRRSSRDLGGHRPALVGRHRLPARRHRLDRRCGAARPTCYGRKRLFQAAIARLPARLRAERRARRTSAQLIAFRGAPGPRRRRADDARHGDRRRPRAAARARPLPGLHPDGLRARERRRAAARRRCSPSTVLALGLLRQPADRRRSRWRRSPRRCPRRPRRAPSGRRSTTRAPALLAGRPQLPAARHHLGRAHYAWASAEIARPRRRAVVLLGALRRAGAPRRRSRSCRCALFRDPVFAVASRRRCSSPRCAFFAVDRVHADVPAARHRRERRPSRACCCSRCCSSATATTAVVRARDQPHRPLQGASRSPGWR